MPVEFLSDEQVSVFGRFDGDPSRPELERFFFADHADVELIAKRRSSHNQLLQSCWWLCRRAGCVGAGVETHG
jgi:hypothetical protein